MNVDSDSQDKSVLLVVLSDGKHAYIKSDPKNIGKRVIVRLKTKKEIGTVVKKVSERTDVSRNLALEFHFPDEIPLLTESMLKICYMIRDRYLCSLGEALKMFYPPGFLKLSVKLLRKDEEEFKKLKAEKLFEALSKRRRISIKSAKKICSFRKLMKLEEKGLIDIVPEKSIKTKEEVERDFEKISSQSSEACSPAYELTEEQINALEAILKSDHSRFLIHGVTGSGKTEVYLQAIQKINGGAIFLLPEISLTTFILSRVKSRFPKVAVLHSGISAKQRLTYWFALRYGITNIVVGARSALFSPVQDLKLIIIDEEHDQSYKQTPDSGKVFYDAREVAFIRAEVEGAKVVLGSATPSIESYYLAKNDHIKLIRMRNRIPGMSVPVVRIIDLRNSDNEMFLSFPLSRELRTEIEKRIERKQNSILLFTRRGWALYVVCSSCGYKFKCSRCSNYLVYHKKEGLVCHWCGSRYGIPSHCLHCGSENLEVIGFGTERIEEELKELFKVPVFRMDSDVIKGEKHARRVLEKFSQTRPSILVGTQMVSKGFDFPSVTLVGVILADTEFIMPDFRADERAFSLLVQVTGRSGRMIKVAENSQLIPEEGILSQSREDENISIIQTYSPDHPILRYAVEQNYEKFYEDEIEKRNKLVLPPFSRIAVLSLYGQDEQRCWDLAYTFERKLTDEGIEHESPVRAIRYIVNNTYNVKIVIYIRKDEDMEKLRRSFRSSVFFFRGIKVVLDISPQSIL